MLCSPKNWTNGKGLREDNVGILTDWPPGIRLGVWKRFLIGFTFA